MASGVSMKRGRAGSASPLGPALPPLGRATGTLPSRPISRSPPPPLRASETAAPSEAETAIRATVALIARRRPAMRLPGTIGGPATSLSLVVFQRQGQRRALAGVLADAGVVHRQRAARGHGL